MSVETEVTPARMDRGADQSSRGGPGWLVLVYHLPQLPTRFRVRVWRRLRALGVLALQPGVVALPDTSQAEAGLVDLIAEIDAIDGGGAHLLRSRALHGEEALVRTYNAALDTAYLGLVEECQRFRRRLGTHPSSRDREARRALDRIDQRLRSLEHRDALDASQRHAARAAYGSCLDDYLSWAGATPRHP